MANEPAIAEMLAEMAEPVIGSTECSSADAPVEEVPKEEAMEAEEAAVDTNEEAVADSNGEGTMDTNGDAVANGEGTVETISAEMVPVEEISSEANPEESVNETDSTKPEMNGSSESTEKPEHADPRVAELEKAFKDRYTEKDFDFRNAMEKKDPVPPIMPIKDHSSSSSRDSKSDERSSKESMERQGKFGIQAFYSLYY